MTASGHSIGEGTISSQIARRRKSALADGGVEYASKRDELIRIAAQLFREKGYQQTTLSDVALVAGIDRASIYYYVGSKEELLRECMGTILQANLGSAEQIAEDHSLDVITRLTQIFELLMDSYVENYPQMFVYMQEQMDKVSRESSSWAKENAKKTRRFEAMVTDLIRVGVATGALRGDIPPKLASLGLFGMFNWTHRWFMPDGPLSARDVSRAFIGIFFNGMRAAKTEA